MSFTTFAASVVVGVTKMDHIALVTVDAEQIHLVKLWLLNQTCTGLESSEMLQPLPATSVAFLKDEKTGAKGGKFAEGNAANEKMAFGRTVRSHSKGKDDKVLEGAISCLYFGERCHEVPDPELFVGFESGAVGMFRVFVTPVKKGDTGMKIQAVKMFSC
jgi:hypothetical protein